MSQTKAQLVAPIGVVTASGVVASGVVTAGTFDGNITGTATSIKQGANLNVGIMSASGFSGDFTGTATGITTGSDIKVGAFTASSFSGDFTGTATSMMRGTGFEAGAVNATGFVANVVGDVTGNTTGLAGSVTSGGNIHVGVMTATSWHGDGGSLTGIAATNFNTQTVTASTPTTSIDLSAGNMVKFNQSTSTTVSFANTSTAMDINILHTTDGDYSISYSTGGVDFNGSSEYIATGANATLAPGTNDFTLEAWINPDTWGANDAFYQTESGGLEVYATTNYIGVKAAGGSVLCETSSRPTLNVWTHVAVSRSGTTLKIFFNGAEVGSATNSTDFTATGSTFIGAGSGYFDGTVSNLRLVVGTALYTASFVPPSAALTNVTNTKLLCCQSNSSATAAAVLSGTTLSGSGTAGAQTVAASGVVSLLNNTLTWPTTVKWNGGTVPTMNLTDSSKQQFQLLTRDGGLTWYGWETYGDTLKNYELFYWGQNASGVGGQNDAIARSSPVQVGGSTWNVLSNTGCLLGVKSDGTLWGSGANSTAGGLGQNDRTNRSSPVQIPGTNWKFIDSFGNTAPLATKTDGTLWAWGNNDQGQLGLNNTTQRSSPTQVGSNTTWNKVRCAGGYSGFGIKTDGTLWAWGTNSYGDLGQNNTTNSNSPLQVGTSTTWANVFPGLECYMAAKTDGTLWSWGARGGHLGQNESDIDHSLPIQIGADTDWSTGQNKVSLITTTAYAIKTNGTLWSWGKGTYGEIGDNTRTQRSSPTQIPGSWSHVSNASENVLATKSDGTLWGWGNDEQGQLAQNGLTAYSSPTQIPGTNWNLENVRIYGKNGIAKQPI